MAAPQQDECQDLPRLPEGADQQGGRSPRPPGRSAPWPRTHLVPGDEAGDHGALGTDPLPVVGTGDRIAIVVGQIGGSAAGWRSAGSAHDGAVEGSPAGCQPRSPAGWRARQGQCSQTRRQQPNRRYLSFVMAKQSDIDRVKGYRTGFGYTWPAGAKLPGQFTWTNGQIIYRKSSPFGIKPAPSSPERSRLSGSD